MAQAQEPNDKDHKVERQLNRAFDRVDEEIDHFEDKVDRLQSNFEGFSDEINQKLDTILRHITGIN